MQKLKKLGTKIILYLSFLTSNYGQSLRRPILTLILINGILFSILNINLNFGFMPRRLIHIADIENTIAKFLWFMNPLHRNDPELKGLPLIIDIFIRMISSYCIYNIIRASRRFIK